MAIDPGNEFSGYVIVDTETYKPLKFGKVKNDEMRSIALYDDYDYVVIEGIASYGMAVGKSVFDTSFFSGRLYEIAYSRDKLVTILYRKDIKLNLCGSVKAKDTNITQALKDRFGDKGTAKNKGFFFGFAKDVWSAMAIAATWIDKTKESGIDS